MVPYQAESNENVSCLPTPSDVLRKKIMQDGSWEVTLPLQEAATE